MVSYIFTVILRNAKTNKQVVQLNSGHVHHHDHVYLWSGQVTHQKHGGLNQSLRSTEMSLDPLVNQIYGHYWVLMLSKVFWLWLCFLHLKVNGVYLFFCHWPVCFCLIFIQSPLAYFNIINVCKQCNPFCFNLKDIMLVFSHNLSLTHSGILLSSIS